MAVDMCRSCLTFGGELYSLTDQPIVVNGFCEIAGIVIDLTTRKWPLSVCSECLQKFVGFYHFKKLIINSNEMLTKNIINCITHKVAAENKSNQEKFDLESADNAKNTDLGNNEKIKEEICIKAELEYLPKAEVFDCDDGFSDEDNCPLKLNKGIGDTVKKKGKKSKKDKSRQNTETAPHRTPRNIIEIDPEKITVIELSQDEQIRVQQEEEKKLSYLSMPFKCGKCFKGFNYERKLQAHDEKYHKTNSNYMCQICSRTMSTASSLIMHLKKHQLLYQCNICLTRFAEKPRAIAHYKSTHEGIQIEIPCKHCDRVFRNRSSLNGHLRNHHPQTERPRCDVCNKTFATRDSLQDHMLIHTGEKNYCCPVCDKKFRLRQTVAIHMLSHSSSRSFYCAPCDVSFKCRSALTYHLRTADKHVTKQQRNENTCDKCGRSFSTPYRLRAHVMTSHLGVKRQRQRRSGDKETRYVCDACGRPFTARRTLLNHLLIHTGVRPHACPQCDATFTQRATRNTHVTRVHRT